MPDKVMQVWTSFGKWSPAILAKKHFLWTNFKGDLATCHRWVVAHYETNKVSWNELILQNESCDFSTFLLSMKDIMAFLSSSSSLSISQDASIVWEVYIQGKTLHAIRVELVARKQISVTETFQHFDAKSYCKRTHPFKIPEKHCPAFNCSSLQLYMGFAFKCNSVNV